MWELCGDVGCAFGYSPYCFVKCYDFLIEFFDSRYGVWYCVKAIPVRMTVSAMLIFGFIVAGHVTRACHCLITLPVVVFICVFHLSDGARLIPKYVYGSCWLRAGISWFL